MRFTIYVLVTQRGEIPPPPCLRPYLQEVLPRHHRLRQDIRGHTGATVLPGGGTQGGGTPGERGLERSVSVHHKKKCVL